MAAVCCWIKYQLMPEQTQTMIKLMKSTSLVRRLTNPRSTAEYPFMRGLGWSSQRHEYESSAMFQYTSSARPISSGDRANPRYFAVFRLTASRIRSGGTVAGNDEFDPFMVRFV